MNDYKKQNEPALAPAGSNGSKEITKFKPGIVEGDTTQAREFLDDRV